MEEEATGPEGLYRAVQRMAYSFYESDGLLAPTRPEWLLWRLALSEYEELSNYKKLIKIT